METSDDGKRAWGEINPFRAQFLRRRATSLTLGSALSLALLGFAGQSTANGAQSTLTPSPSTVVQQTLTLVGASANGVAAIQGDRPDAGNLLLTGAYGSVLRNRGTSYLDPSIVSGVVAGHALRFQEDGGPVAQLNLFTGTKSAYPLSLGPLYASDPVRVAWTPDGWLEWSSNTLNAGGVPSASLTRKSVIGSTVTSTTLVTDIQHASSSAVVTAQADSRGVLEWLPVMVSGNPMQRLALSTKGKAGIDTLALLPYDSQGVPAPSDSYIFAYSLSSTMISWVVTTNTLDSAGNGTTTYVLHQRARKGGAISTVTLPAGYAGEPIVGAAKRVALVETASPSHVQIYNGKAWHTVSLPAASSGLAGTGYNFVTAVSGLSTIAGIYQIKTTGGAVRVATASGPDPAS